MRNLVVITLFLITATLAVSAQTLEGKNYIKLTYGGPRADRYIVDVFFSNESILSQVYISGLFFKVRQKDFTAIKKAIMSSREVTEIDTSEAGYYRFMINSDSVTILFKAINPEKVNNVFNEILKQISKPSQRKKVSSTFELIYKDILNPY